MNRPIIPKSTWKYVGPNPGRGEPHVVLTVNRDEVITSSGTHGWIGAPDVFRVDFAARDYSTDGKTWKPCRKEVSE